MAELRPKPGWECEGEEEDLPPPFHVSRDRLQEQAGERVLRAHGDAENDGDSEKRAEHALAGLERGHAETVRGGGAERKQSPLNASDAASAELEFYSF